jgi:Fe-S cluster biosynthesis and repair protein YggX
MAPDSARGSGLEWPAMQSPGEVSSMSTVSCIRCGRADAPALSRPPLPGPAGAEIRGQVCADCWAEWTQMEVMVINELRLNFMDAGSQEILDQHLRKFLGLDGAEPARPDLPGIPPAP